MLMVDVASSDSVHTVLCRSTLHECQLLAMKLWTSQHSFMQIKAFCLNIASLCQIPERKWLSWEEMANKKELKRVADHSCQTNRGVQVQSNFFVSPFKISENVGPSLSHTQAQKNSAGFKQIFALKSKTIMFWGLIWPCIVLIRIRFS